MYTYFGQKKLKGRDHSEDLSDGRKIILEWILGKQGRRVSSGFIWSGTGTSGEPL